MRSFASSVLRLCQFLLSLLNETEVHLTFQVSIVILGPRLNGFGTRFLSHECMTEPVSSYRRREGFGVFIVHKVFILSRIIVSGKNYCSVRTGRDGTKGKIFVWVVWGILVLGLAVRNLDSRYY